MDVDAVVPPPYVGAPLRLLPFRGRLLEPSRVGDPASARLFSRPYRAVADRLRQWQERGRVVGDEQPALYLHEYTALGITVRGWVGALDLTRRTTGLADRAVLPHEGVHPGQADDLADRMAEMQLNPAPILLVHRASPALRDVARHVVEQPPEREFTDRAGQVHRIWAVRDAATWGAVAAELASDRGLIADGHHRYAAYLRLQARQPGTGADRGLAMLVDQGETPLFLGPIHRLLTGVTLADVEQAARTLGLPAVRSDGTDYDGLGPDTVVVTDGRHSTALGLRSADRTLVEAFHLTLVPALRRGPRAISYHHSVDATLAVLGRRHGVAALFPAPAFDEVLATVEQGRLLPEKATSFQPKPSPGLLMRALCDECDAGR